MPDGLTSVLHFFPLTKVGFSSQRHIIVPQIFKSVLSACSDMFSFLDGVCKCFFLTHSCQQQSVSILLDVAKDQ